VALNVVSALLPVVVFLAILFLMDSFKLVPFRAVVAAVVVGAGVAMVTLALHAWLMPITGLSRGAFSRYVAPVTEETLKAAYVVLVLRRRRLGFLVDAALVGFAVGSGFALAENIDYLRSTPDPRLALWLVRGFGPAILHGTATAIFAMLAKNLTDRYPRRAILTLLPGWAVAAGLHSLFNHFALPPIVATCVLLVALPLVVTFVFDRSERATREWVGEGLDLDVELLNLVTSADFGRTRLGAYLRELRAHFPGPVVADMFCLLRLELELAIRAKGMLMAREAGLSVPVDADVKARLQELTYLQRSIGATGLLALKPLRVASERDDWHRYLLEQAGIRPGRVLRRVLTFGRRR
jgi:RsiW-degrading membrane proteinase PrsW (M82 family)